MAVLAQDYNPKELTKYLQSKHPTAQISYEKVYGVIDVIYCSLLPEDLKLPSGWKLLPGHLLTNLKRGKQNVYYIHIL